MPPERLPSTRARSPLLVHYVVGEIFLWHMSHKPVSRVLRAPLRRFADYTTKWIASADNSETGILCAKRNGAGWITPLTIVLRVFVYELGVLGEYTPGTQTIISNLNAELGTAYDTSWLLDRCHIQLY